MENKLEDYKEQLHKHCDESCFYNCSQAGSIKPQCLNKTKEQLAVEYAEKFRYIIQDLSWLECHIKDLIAGYDSRQPEIDRLEKELFNLKIESSHEIAYLVKEIDSLEIIISGKTFYYETDVLKAEIEALKEQSINFAEWLNDNCQLKSSLPKNTWYYVDSDSNRHRLTTEQLFQEYLKQTK